MLKDSPQRALPPSSPATTTSELEARIIALETKVDALTKQMEQMRKT